MTEIRAFVGHSFAPDDRAIVRKFLDCFEEVRRLNPNFTWETAELAEPVEVADKVLRILSDKNLFIGICTRKERVVSEQDLRKTGIWRDKLQADERKFVWKTSDWAIQEIGLAMGRELPIILLIENDVRPPGAIQGNLEYVQFDRRSPEKSFIQLTQMIANQLPRVPAATTAIAPAVTTQEGQREEPEPEKAPFLTPAPTWTRQQWESAFLRLMVMDDLERAEHIYDEYLRTADAAESDHTATWEARREWCRIAFGKGGHLQVLKDLAEAHPSSSGVSELLAQSQQFFGANASAAKTFKHAASNADGNEKLRLLGQAAKAHAEDGASSAALAVLDEMRLVVQSTPAKELALLTACRAVTEMLNDHQANLAIMERLTEISPDDTALQFKLALKHGEHGNNDLSLFHYLRIPAQDRDSGTWNNIGVASGRAVLPGKSIAAYKRSEALGETLAISNLARSLIGSGFLDDAEQQCRAAMTQEGFHENLGSTLARISSVRRDEDRKETDILVKAKLKSEFYGRVGQATTSRYPAEIARLWKGPRCILNVEVAAGSLIATGSYDQPQNPLASAIIGLGSNMPPTTMREEYKCTVRGRAILGEVTRSREGEPSPTLLTSADRQTLVLMILSEDGSTIDVMESPQNSAPSYYSLSKLPSAQEPEPATH